MSNVLEMTASIADFPGIVRTRRTSVNQPVPQAHGTRALIAMMLGASGFFLAVSSFRHYVFRSGGLDLGFFDQAVYLISQGKPPISSFLNFHVLADHAAVILYPLALVYKIWPDPHMLLLVQAITLASGAWPVSRLARDCGLEPKQALAMAAAYLMYPLVLTTNLFDFHPEIFAIPGLLWAIVAAREGRALLFISGICLTLACKEVMSLTVIAMGLWLLVFERRRFCGAFALCAGIAWFIFATQFLIPHFAAGKQPSGLGFYRYLGTSLKEVIVNALVQPQLVLHHLFTRDALKYVLVLAIPLVWGLRLRMMAPLLAALPAIVLNLISENPHSRNPIYQYSVPVIPFLFLSVIMALAARKAWIAAPRGIVAWSVMSLVIAGAARGRRLLAGDSSHWQSLAETRAALAQVRGDGNVLTTHEISPHLAHRPWIQTLDSQTPLLDIAQFEYVLLHSEQPSVEAHNEKFAEVLTKVSRSAAFEKIYERGDVVLFKRRGDGASPDVARAANAD